MCDTFKPSHPTPHLLVWSCQFVCEIAQPAILQAISLLTFPVIILQPALPASWCGGTARQKGVNVPFAAGFCFLFTRIKHLDC